MSSPTSYWEEIGRIVEEKWRESATATIVRATFLSYKQLLEHSLKAALFTLNEYSGEKALEVAKMMIDSREGKLRKIREESEKRELTALSRRKGTDIRRALVEREALPAGYHEQRVEQCEGSIINLLERISSLFPAKEAELFVGAFSTKDKDLKEALSGIGILSLVIKLITIPQLVGDIDSAIRNSLEPINVANRSKSRLAGEGIDVGEFNPAPTFIPNGILDKITVLKLLLQSLGRARAHWRWLESLYSK